MLKKKMKKLNFNMGGDQSGHIILGKFSTTEEAFSIDSIIEMTIFSI